MIPGKRTLLPCERTGLVEFARASALRRQEWGRVLCSGVLPGQDGSGMTF
jgi:hypothetical protein